MAARHNTTTTPPRLIGAKRASAEFGIKYTSLRDIVHRGELQFIRIGRAMYFERRDLEAWIESRKQKAS